MIAYILKTRRAKIISSNENLNYYSFGALVFAARLDGSIVSSTYLKISFLHRLLSLSPFFRRMLRLEVRSAIIDCEENCLIVCFKESIFEIDLKDFKVYDKVFTEFNGSVLNFECVSEISGFENGIYFGEYFNNKLNSEVHVFVRKSVGRWLKIHSFEANAIYHVHNIVSDKYRDVIWICTGDEDEQSSIIGFSQGFNFAPFMFSGSQLYRTCNIITRENGIYYCTDSPIDNNWLVFIDMTCLNDLKARKLCQIPGPVIYSIDMGSCIVFSTSIEPQNFITRLSLLKLLTPATFIKPKNEMASIIKFRFGSKDIVVLEEYFKDFWPYELFQYGKLELFRVSDISFQTYGIALKRFNMKTKLYDL